MVRRLRTAVLERASSIRLVWFAAIACLGVGAVLALEGRWALAVGSFTAGLILLWLCGAWVVPRGRDALARYYGRVLEVWRDRNAAVDFVSFRARQQRAKLRARFERLRPPEGFEEEHARLTDLLDRAGEVDRNASPSLIEQDRAGIVSLRTAREVMERLISRTRDAPGNYARGLEQLARKSAEDTHKEDRSLERADEALARSIAKLRPPPEVAPEHDALLASLRRYLAAEKDVRAAYRLLDAEAVTRSVSKHDSASADLDTAFAALQERLGDSGAWAVRRDDIAEADRASRQTG